MVETNTTRRRVLQGAGAIGIATLGSTTISAQETNVEGSAIRVVHGSPDAPAVDVRLSTASSGGMTTSNETSDGATTSGENETAVNETAGGANETAGNETVGGENASDNTTVSSENESDGGGILSGGILGGNESGGGSQTESEPVEGDEPLIEGLSFGNVSSYNEVEPGTYQVEIVTAEDETTVLDAQVDVEEDTTYTVVAFGEVGSSQLPVEEVQTDSGTTETETETGGVGGNETETEVGGNETETEAGVGGNETETGGTSTTAQGSELVSSLSYGQYETVTVDAGDYTLVFEESSTAGTDSGLGETETETETPTETETESGGVGNESNDSDVGGTETETEIAGNETETETGGTETTDSEITSQEGGSESGFRVQVLEDDLSAPGEESARLRVFHAVPDVGTLSVSRQSSTSSAGGANETTTEAGGMNETTAEAGGMNETTTEAGGMNETTTEAGGMNETTTEAGGANETVTTDGGVTTEEDGASISGQTAEFTAEANTAYSGFAMGYFDPQAAASAESETNASAEGGMTETETETGGIGNESEAGNESEVGMNETETEEAGLGGNESEAGNESGAGMTETETETSASAVADEQPEEFQFVVAEDAQDGERSEGDASGSSGGLL